MKKNLKDAMSQYSVEDMYRYTQNMSPDCRVFTSEEEMENLFTLLSRNSHLCGSPLGVDTITENHICYNICEINESYIFDGEMKWDRFTVVIFPNYQEIINKSPCESVIIGFIHFIFDKTLDCIVPLACFKGYPDIGLGDAFARSKSNPSIDILPMSVADSVRGIMCYTMSLWRPIQCASVNSFFNGLLIFAKTKTNVTCKLDSENIKYLIDSSGT